VSLFEVARQRMVSGQLGGIQDHRVRAALAAVPREAFVPDVMKRRAYEDRPLPIACRQTISQPWIVARMTELLALTGTETVLEVGTGSGYQAAVLSRLCSKVITVERHGDLAREASRALAEQGCRNVTVLTGDGTMGRSDQGPYDAILVTAGAPEVPRPLLAQLRDGGRLVIPVGTEDQQTLTRVTRQGDGYTTEHFERCTFVPLLGRFGWKKTG
jgi:protein-L-isoaspartate(D-aspartate) O-methyltransferase